MSPPRSPCTGCRAWRAGCRRSWSTWTAWPPRTWPRAWPGSRSASGRTTPGTHWTCTGAWDTPTSRCGSASSTTTPPKKSTNWSTPFPGSAWYQANPDPTSRLVIRSGQFGARFVMICGAVSDDKADRGAGLAGGPGLPVSAVEDGGQSAQVDVAARDHADDLARARPPGQRGGHGERAGALGDHPGALGH